MKKRNRRQLELELAYGTKRYVRELKRKHITYSRFPRSQIGQVFGGHKIIEAPKIISIYEVEANHCTDTIDFIEELKSYFGKTPCVIDFRQTEKISAAAILAIFATIDDASKSGEEHATILWSKPSPAVNRLIKRTKLHRLIRHRYVKYDFTNSSTLPIISGYGGGYIDSIIDFIQRKVYDNKISPETEYVYGDAVSETINNVGLHAYPGKEPDQKKWWLICDLIGTHLYLAICDLGVGIPKTVVDKPWFLLSLKNAYPEEYAELQKVLPEEASGISTFILQKFKDSQLIYLSMQGDVTGTKKSKHGQGSKSIRKLVSDTLEGKLWVFSNKGLYTFETEDDTPQLHKLPRKLSGTLVQWNIKIT